MPINLEQQGALWREQKEKESQRILDIPDPNSCKPEQVTERKDKIALEITPKLTRWFLWIDDARRDERLLAIQPLPPEFFDTLRESTRSATVTIIENLERRGVQFSRDLFIKHLSLEIAAKIVHQGVSIEGIRIPDYRSRRGAELIPIDGNGNYVFVHIDPAEAEIRQVGLNHGIMPRKYNSERRSPAEEKANDPFVSLTSILLGPETFSTERSDTNVYANDEQSGPFTGWQGSSKLPETNEDQYAVIYFGKCRGSTRDGGMPMISGSSNREIQEIHIAIDATLSEEAKKSRLEYYKTWVQQIRTASKLNIPVLFYMLKDSSMKKSGRRADKNDYTLVEKI